MTNVKRKSLVYALILTLCLGVIPFNVASFQAAAKTKSKAPAVTAKTYSKKAGRYTLDSRITTLAFRNPVITIATFGEQAMD